MANYAALIIDFLWYYGTLNLILLRQNIVVFFTFIYFRAEYFISKCHDCFVFSLFVDTFVSSFILDFQFKLMWFHRVRLSDTLQKHFHLILPLLVLLYLKYHRHFPRWYVATIHSLPEYLVFIVVLLYFLLWIEAIGGSRWVWIGIGLSNCWGYGVWGY